MEPIQQVALSIAASTLVFLLAVHFRPGHARRRGRGLGARLAQEGGLAVLSGGFVSLLALAAVPLLPEGVAGATAAAGDGTDPATLLCVLATLALLCGERGQWTGHQPATILAALVPWLLVPEWTAADAPRLPAAPIGLVSAALYRVIFSGARSARLADRARHAAVEATGDGVLVVDAEGHLVDANAKGREAFRELSSREHDPSTGRPVGPPRLPARVRNLLARPAAQHFNLRNASDRVYEIWLGSADAGDPANTNRALILRDVSEQRRDEQHLLRLAHYDSLTGLANRRLFVQQLERALKGPNAQLAGVGLLYIDLDRFKEINDSLGHGAGDELLRVLAERFQEHLRTAYPPRLHGPSGASVARLGGDEFAVILPEPEDEAAVERLARGLLEAIAQPMMLADREISGSGSIGIALYPGDGRDVETLVKHADSALYGAKRLGRNRYQRYKPEFSREADRVRAIEQELRGAIERGEFELHYQPKIEVENDTVGGFEALLRWRSRELGTVGPEEFIPIAEERGLIARIGAWCLDEACRQQRAWIDAGLEPVPVAVNVSSAQFIGSNLQDLVRRALDANDVDPALLEIELTERLLLEDNEQTARCLADLEEIGVPVALDDFGTGYSALTYLNRFPLSVVKMDRGLLVDIETSDSAAGIAAAVIAMCHSLGLEVVAEGVDAEGQLEMLREMSCDLIQGFLFSPAMRADDVVRFLAPPGAPRPRLEPKPVLRPARPDARVEPELEIDLTAEDEWEATDLDADRPAGPLPRALVIEDGGSLAGIVERLERIGVEVHRSPMEVIARGFVPPTETGFHLIVAPAEGDLYLTAEVLDRVQQDQPEMPPSLLLVGEEPDEAWRAAIREVGARWVLWAPFEDAELRFLVRASMPSDENLPGRLETRIPMDAMAWLRFRSRRDVGVLSSLSRRGAFIEMTDPLEVGVSLKLEFEIPEGRISTFAKVVYQQKGSSDRLELFAGGIGVTFYGLDPASEFTIGELVEANAARYRP